MLINQAFLFSRCCSISVNWTGCIHCSLIWGCAAPCSFRAWNKQLYSVAMYLHLGVWPNIIAFIIHKLDTAVNIFELWVLGLPIDNFIFATLLYAIIFWNFAKQNTTSAFLELKETPLQVVKMWPESISDKHVECMLSHHMAAKHSFHVWENETRPDHCT